jgi:hypothetical protein
MALRPDARVRKEIQMAKTNKTDREVRNRQAIAGVQKHITSPIVVGGVSRTPAEVVAILQDPITKSDLTAAAEGTFHAAVATEKASVVASDVVYEDLKAVVLTLFKGQPATLLDFGITVKVRKEPSAAAKAAAAAKRKAKAEAKKAAATPAAAPTPVAPKA